MQGAGEAMVQTQGHSLSIEIYFLCETGGDLASLGGKVLAI